MTTSRRHRLLGVLAVLALSAGMSGSALHPARAAAPRTGEVYVVHGIVGPAVDVQVDGRVVARKAAPKSIIGPLKLRPGSHVVTLRDGSSTVTTARFSVVAGASIDLVAHRSADAARSPRIVVFRNNLAPVGRGKTRLVVSHTAVAPPADIRIDGEPFFRNVASGESLSLVVPAKTYSVDVMPSAGGARILAPVRLTLQPGTLTRVFAIGDPTERTADAIVQVLKVGVTGSGAPTRVPTGDGGQAAEAIVGQGGGLAGAPTLVLLGGLAVLALIGAGRGSAHGMSVVRSRHAR